MGGSLESSGEGDWMRVRCGLPSRDPACLAAAGGVKGLGREVEALQCRLLVRGSYRGLGRPCGNLALIDSIRVGRADHLPDHRLVFQERHKIPPRSCATAARSPDSAGPTWLRTRRISPWLSRVNRLERTHDRILVLPAGVTEAVADQVHDALLHDSSAPRVVLIASGNPL